MTVSRRQVSPDLPNPLPGKDGRSCSEIYWRLVELAAHCGPIKTKIKVTLPSDCFS